MKQAVQNAFETVANDHKGQSIPIIHELYYMSMVGNNVLFQRKKNAMNVLYF